LSEGRLADARFADDDHRARWYVREGRDRGCQRLAQAFVLEQQGIGLLPEAADLREELAIDTPRLPLVDFALQLT
jgi:hypothetical protein